MARLRWREVLVAASGLLVVGSGFLPWWTVPAAGAGSAWMSARWSAALLLAAGAVVLWLIWRFVWGRVPVPVWLVTLAAVTVSAFLTLEQRAVVRERWGFWVGLGGLCLVGVALAVSGPQRRTAAASE